MYYKKSLILLSIFLVLILSTNASLISETNQAALCPEQTHLFLDVIKNDGNSEQQYLIDIYGSALPWSASIPRGFVLKPGEVRSIYTYVTPMSNTPPGEYDLYIDVSSESLKEKACHSILVNSCKLVKPETEKQKKVVIKQEQPKVVVRKVKASEVVVQKPTEQKTAEVKPAKIKPNYNFSVYLERNYAGMCDHSQDTIPITIENQGDAINKFYINLDGPSWAKLGKKSLIIPEKTSQIFNLILTPDYSTKGIFDINIEVEPDKGSIKAKGLVKAEVRQCNSVEVGFLDKKQEICNPIIQTYTATIKNTGSIANTYNLKLDAPKFILFSKNSVAVNPGQEEVVLLKINNSYVKPGKYKIVLEAGIPNSKIKSSDGMELAVLNDKECNKQEKTNETSVFSRIKTSVTGYYVRAKNYTHNIISKEKATNETACAEDGGLTKITGMLENAEKKTEKLFDLDLEIGDQENFTFNNEEHFVTLESIENGTALIAIKSNKTNYVLLKVNEAKLVDLNDDGISDIRVSLNSLEDEVASLTFSKFGANTAVSNNISSKAIRLLKAYKYYIIVVAILLFLIILISKTKFHKKAATIFSEEIESTELAPLEQAIPSLPEEHKDTPWEKVVEEFEQVRTPGEKLKRQLKKKPKKRKIKQVKGAKKIKRKR